MRPKGRSGYACTMNRETTPGLKVRVLFFASWKDTTGRGEAELELPPGATTRDALEAVVARWPELAPRAAHVALAVNQTYADGDRPLADGDELAIVPPVSGGCAAPADTVRIGPEPIDGAALMQAVVLPGCGAVCTFAGTTRDHHEGRRVIRLEYEAHLPMAQREIRALVEQARARWELGAVAVHHRVGRVAVGEMSVLIAVSAPHRAEAFEAGRFLIDRLKETVPIWKREQYESGAAWIEGDRARTAREDRR